MTYQDAVIEWENSRAQGKAMSPEMIREQWLHGNGRMLSMCAANPILAAQIGTLLWQLDGQDECEEWSRGIKGVQARAAQE